MENAQMQQQLNTLKDDVNSLQRQNARKSAIDNHIKSNYDNQTPQDYAGELLRLVKERYTLNTAIWKRVIRAMGTAYESAHNNFNTIVNIRRQEALARQQMVANILSVFAGASLCWIGSAVREWKRFDRTFKTEGAKTFFSDGFGEVVKASGIGLTQKISEISFKEHLPNTDDALSNPLGFQNSLLNAFERCSEKVVAQLSEIIESIKSNGEGGPLQNILSQHSYDINNYSLSDRQIIAKVDSAYGSVKQFVENMNTHCIKESIYFREKPDFEVGKEFEKVMAVRFERAMWAAWIPSSLKRKKRLQQQAPRTLVPSQPWKFENYTNAQLQSLQPGFYYIMGNPDYVMRVYEVLEKPGKTLENRLEVLQVFKPKKYHPNNIPPEGVKQLERFGWVTSDSEISRLIAWARTEPQSQFGLAQFPFKERDRSELIIRPLA